MKRALLLQTKSYKVMMKQMESLKKNRKIRNAKGVFVVGIISLGIMSCNSDDDLDTPFVETTQTNVSFELDASMLDTGVSSRALTPVYNANGFSIYAFKQENNTGEYKFAQMLNLSNAKYIPDTKTYTGNASLEAGNYKFIPAYGINQSSNISLPINFSQPLTDEIVLAHSLSGSNGNNLPEIFLPAESEHNYRVENIRSFNMDINGRLNESVRLQIERAVARVDVMFIKAIKNGNTYTEVQTTQGQDIFGNQGLDKMELRFTNLNQRMNLLGLKQSSPFNGTIDVQHLGGNGQAITIGSRAGASLIGTDNYLRFDDIHSDDIIYGAAHVFGSYLIPNNDEVPTTGLQVYIETAKGTKSRTINITNDNDNLLPLARNKVTLVKIYILTGNGGGTDPTDPPVDPPGPVDPPIDPPGPVDPPVNPPVDPPGPPDVYNADIEVKVEFVDWYDSNYLEEEID